MSQVGRESRVESDRMGGMDNTLDDKGASYSTIHEWYSRPNTNGITTSRIPSLFHPLPSAPAAALEIGSAGWIARESRLTCLGTGEFMLSSGKDLYSPTSQPTSAGEKEEGIGFLL
ncbi:hypothetical protein CKAN_01550400 [Cinnamomum micranthum f. kanehirae]|uniref:Uncharacterized protein n=1 Tax=Cinnamomum micranthum f. kanehirae TaxID=337451 RepID=A0A443P753_9MAGN|nr:hypothetical protein CKAN_01550400 [Cinnamomum micranthum f. kanehirae]